MPSFLITRSSSTVRGVRKTTFSRKIAIGESTLVILLVVLISLVSLLYLVHSNKSATKGYALKMLEREYQELVQINEVWNMRIAESKAMRTILSSNVVNGMYDSDEVIFLEPKQEKN